MLATRWIAACAVALAVGAAGQPRESADLKELTRLEGVWNAAHLRGDTATLDRLWADDFVVTVPNMRPLFKADALGMWRSGKMKFLRYETSDLRMRVYGDAAVVTGRLLRTRNIQDRDLVEDWRFTKVFVRKAKSWQVVAFHASSLPQPRPTRPRIR